MFGRFLSLSALVVTTPSHLFTPIIETQLLARDDQLTPGQRFNKLLIAPKLKGKQSKTGKLNDRRKKQK